MSGAFKRFDHDYFFEETTTGETLMRDVFDYESPLGWLGRIADWLFLEKYMASFLKRRNALIKEVVEERESRELHILSQRVTPSVHMLGKPGCRKSARSQARKRDFTTISDCFRIGGQVLLSETAIFGSALPILKPSTTRPYR